PGVALLEYALARRGAREEAAVMGARGDPHAARAACRNALSRTVRRARAALRLRPGALGDDVSRRADVLVGRLLLSDRAALSAGARGGRDLRAAARILRRAALRGCGLLRVPPASGLRHARLQSIHRGDAARG